MESMSNLMPPLVFWRSGSPLAASPSSPLARLLQPARLAACEEATTMRRPKFGGDACFLANSFMEPAHVKLRAELTHSVYLPLSQPSPMASAAWPPSPDTAATSTPALLAFHKALNQACAPLQRALQDEWPAQWETLQRCI